MMSHDPCCRCSACCPPGRTPIEQVDRDCLADEWLRCRPDEPIEAASIRSAGWEGAPGSPRRIALQAIADTRVAAGGASVGVTAEARS